MDTMALKAWQIILIVVGALVGLFFLASIAIGGLVYFGAFSPSKTLPDKCQLEPGLECLEYTVTPSEVVLVLGNSLGRDVTFKSITVTEITGLQNCIFDASAETEGLPLANGQTVNVILACDPSGVKVGKRYRYDLEGIYHYKDSDLTLPLSGKISTTVK